MELETIIKDNSLLDIDYYSNHTERSRETKILLDAIYGKIGLLYNDYKDAKIEESNISFENDRIIGETPKFNDVQIPRFKNYISKSQNWICYVLELSHDSFFAKLEDLNNPNTYETAHFDIDEVSKEDLELLKVGAIFYWSVGYANQNGQVIKQSLIRFKRAVEITEYEFDEIADETKEIIKDLNWD